MPLRVTAGMMNTQLLRNLNTNMQKMDNIQTQMSTGRKLNKPSDDPVGITYSLRYRSELSSNEQYQKNIDGALSWLQFNDTILSQANSVFQRLKELANQGGTGTNPQSALDAIKSEVDQLGGQLVDIANSQMNGKYVFNGQKIDTKPYNDLTSAPGVLTDSYALNYDVGAGVKLDVNMTGKEVFGAPAGTPEDTDKDNAFQIILDLSAALKSGNYKGVTAVAARIDSRIDKILTSQSEIGAKQNRVELMESRMKDLGLNITELQSKTEDADYEKLIIDSKVNESIYNATLSAGSKIIQPSLVDFLR